MPNIMKKFDYRKKDKRWVPNPFLQFRKHSTKRRYRQYLQKAGKDKLQHIIEARGKGQYDAMSKFVLTQLWAWNDYMAGKRIAPAFFPNYPLKQLLMWNENVRRIRQKRTVYTGPKGIYGIDPLPMTDVQIAAIFVAMSTDGDAEGKPSIPVACVNHRYVCVVNEKKTHIPFVLSH